MEDDEDFSLAATAPAVIFESNHDTFDVPPPPKREFRKPFSPADEVAWQSRSNLGVPPYGRPFDVRPNHRQEDLRRRDVRPLGRDQQRRRLRQDQRTMQRKKKIYIYLGKKNIFKVNFHFRIARFAIPASFASRLPTARPPIPTRKTPGSRACTAVALPPSTLC